MTLAGLVGLATIPVALVAGFRAGQYDRRHGGYRGMVTGLIGVIIYTVLTLLLAAAL